MVLLGLSVVGQGLMAVALELLRHQSMVGQQLGQCHRKALKLRWAQGQGSLSHSLDFLKTGMVYLEITTSRAKTPCNRTVCT